MMRGSKMGLCKELARLEPEFLSKVEVLLSALDSKKIKYYINETYRSQEVQDAYYSQGRDNLVQVNTLRKKAGLWEITAKENIIITRAKVSYHTSGKAIDIYPVDTFGSIIWKGNKDSLSIANIARDLGLDCGYFWRDFFDPYHIQM
jgi:hypothetical protein